MQQSTTVDIYTYSALLLGLFVLHRISKSIPKSKSVSLSAVLQIVLRIIKILLLLSGFLYWRIRATTISQPGFDTWVIALDIAVTHIVVTLSLALFALFLFFPILKPLSVVAMALTLIVSKAIWKDEDDIPSWLSLLVYGGSPVMIAMLGCYLAIRIFLVETIDMQVFLFGAFDPQLGFRYPTTFRFSVLYPHLRATFQTLAGNKALADIIGFLTISITFVLAVSGLIKAVDYFVQKFRK